MRFMPSRGTVGILVIAAGVVIAAQQPPPQTPPQGQGRGGRGGVQIQPGQECPPGTTLVRPGSCQAPEFPPPSIVDYRPKSTLVTDQHLVPKAKFPVVDLHGHIAGGGANYLNTPESVAQLAAILDTLNVRVSVSADTLSGDRLVKALDAVAKSTAKDRVRILTGISFNGIGTPGWADRTIAQLEADMKAGAVGIGEISKSFGLRTKKADGSRLRVDDPEIDPVWDACARLGVTVFIHTAEPQEFFQPMDMSNERWLELSLYADRRNNQPGGVTFDELMTERDNMFRKHPKTRFIAAHFGWHANDLKRAAKMLDDFPNVYTEVGAILYDLGRQPRAAHDFFVKYQDRILFGKDAFEPSEFPYYWRVFETKDEYFDYYRNYHAFWKLYGMDLPDVVLKKLYYQNALKLLPGMPKTGWPQ